MLVKTYFRVNSGFQSKRLAMIGKNRLKLAIAHWKYQIVCTSVGYVKYLHSVRLMFLQLMSEDQEWNSDSTGNINGEYSGETIDVLDLEWQILKWHTK